LGYAELVEENTSNGGAKVVKVTGVKNPGKTVSVVCTGANSLVLEESERSLHDALCVVRCLVKKRSVNRPLFRSEIHEIPIDDQC
jgi:T-complex protein 1 subunit delta